MPMRLVSGIGAKAGANIGRLFKEAKALYAPGGEYMKGIEAQLARGQKKTVATGMQGLAAAGLAGTSMAGGLGLKYEEDVATPARAQATTARLGALSGLLAQEAQVQMQTAPRYGYQAPRPQGRRGVSMPSAQQRQPSRQTARPQRQPQQQVPSPPTYPKTAAPGGYGVYFGKAFYNKQAQATPAPKKPLSSYYDIGGELGI